MPPPVASLDRNRPLSRLQVSQLMLDPQLKRNWDSSKPGHAELFGNKIIHAPDDVFRNIGVCDE